MSLRLRLLTGVLEGCPAVPSLELAAGTTIPEVFLRSSRREDSEGDIRLSIDRSRQDQVRHLSGNPATSVRLHLALRRLTRNRPNASRIVRIGMLFADRYAHGRSGALGVMFDRGFATDDDPLGAEPRFGIPREGCALFLGAIGAIRSGLDSPEFKRQVFYTAVHELGHLFNLGHSLGENYMARSHAEQVHPRDFFEFNEKQVRWLSSCSTSPSVWPGGHVFRGGTSSDEAFEAPAPGLAISVMPSRTTFWPWEPFELDLQLSLADSASQSVSIPDEVDPGYDRLHIWIEDPSGQRRLYRSPRHYCSSQATIHLEPGERFVRDVSLFGQSGGYTFYETGVHRIWAEWNPNTPARLRSEKIEVEILGAGHPLPAEAELLRNPAAARLMYYRHGSRRSRVFRSMEEFAQSGRPGPTRAHIAYATGRAHAAHWTSSKSDSSRRNHAARAHDALDRASQETGLGEHARALCFRLMAELREER